MFYVKVEKGQIVEGPKELSNSESASPNVNWGYSQLKANGYFLVDLTHDPLTQKIDYSSPLITDDAVVYTVVWLNTDEATAKYNEKQISLRASEYPTVQEITVALWEKLIEGRSDSADLLQQKRLSIKQKYPKK